MGCCGSKNKDSGIEYVVTVRGSEEEKVFADRAAARIHAVSMGKGATVIARKKATAT